LDTCWFLRKFLALPTSRRNGTDRISKRSGKHGRRRKPPVSQDDLAGKLAAKGVSLDQSAVSRIENGTRYVMDYEAVALAKALKISVGCLFGE